VAEAPKRVRKYELSVSSADLYSESSFELTNGCRSTVSERRRKRRGKKKEGEKRREREKKRRQSGFPHVIQIVFPGAKLSNATALVEEAKEEERKKRKRGRKARNP